MSPLFSIAGQNRLYGQSLDSSSDMYSQLTASGDMYSQLTASGDMYSQLAASGDLLGELAAEQVVLRAERDHTILEVTRTARQLAEIDLQLEEANRWVHAPTNNIEIVRVSSF